jgi:hypothetical protein
MFSVYPNALHSNTTNNRMRPLLAPLLVSAFVFHAPAGAAQTFRTYRAQVSTDTNVQEVVPSGGPESRPADQDPDGHWGAPTEGFQLSVRFPTNTFLLGDPIVAYAYLRNVTNSYREYFFGLEPMASPVCDVVISDARGQELPCKKRFNLMGSSGTSRVQPLMQNRYWVRLDTIVDLRRPGDYTVRATAVVLSLDRKRRTNISSGTAVIRMIARDSSTNATPGSTAPPAPAPR